MEVNEDINILMNMTFQEHFEEYLERQSSNYSKSLARKS
jgi:hypothetical protein